MLALEPLAVKKEGLRISYPASDGYRLWRKTGEDTPEGFFPALSVKIVETLKRIPAFSNTPVDIIPITEDAQEFVKIEFGFQSSYTGKCPCSKLCISSTLLSQQGWSLIGRPF